VVGALVAVGLAVHQSKPAWYARFWYPLEYDAAINRDAGLNGLDPIGTGEKKPVELVQIRQGLIERPPIFWRLHHQGR
jgi:hypothetical protein